MKVEIFALCDAATDQRGKLNILGTFDQLYAPRVPVIHPASSLAIRMRFDKIEEGEHQIHIDLVDPDGQAVIQPMEGKIEARMAPEMESVAINLVLNMHRLKLDTFADYQFNLAVDGKNVASLPLYLRQAPSA